MYTDEENEDWMSEPEYEGDDSPSEPENTLLDKEYEDRKLFFINVKGSSHYTDADLYIYPKRVLGTLLRDVFPKYWVPIITNYIHDQNELELKTSQERAMEDYLFQNATEREYIAVRSECIEYFAPHYSGLPAEPPRGSPEWKFAREFDIIYKNVLREIGIMRRE